jgi:DNA (cytosine-5)-methyltransferase 1
VSTLTAVSLFSGCGGSDIGLAAAGATVLFANDINRDAVATYRRYQATFAQDAEVVHGDIRKIRAFPKSDLLVGCYPCQSFSMGGARSPADDGRTLLFREFHRVLLAASPKYFIVENVPGMAWLAGGRFLREQIALFKAVPPGYRVTWKLLNGRDYGLPADRKRVFIVGVRRDLDSTYAFPKPTHGSGLSPFASHGDAIAAIPLDDPGDYYHRANEPFSWWYMSRNRKRKWEEPAFTVQANWRHVGLHPASPVMEIVESNLKNKSRQRWEFTDSWDHLADGRQVLEQARRLSWRECALLQTFPEEFEPVGSVQSKYLQIGNAVPPRFMNSIAAGLVTGSALVAVSPGSVEQ